MMILLRMMTPVTQTGGLIGSLPVAPSMDGYTDDGCLLDGRLHGFLLARREVARVPLLRWHGTELLSGVARDTLTYE